MVNRISGQFLLALLPVCLAAQSSLPVISAPQDEIYYHIFTRSFFDSNGDSIGDFAGIAQQLDYLQSLGVTSIWISPIARARCYHNYFADDFDSVDAAFGTREGFFALVREVHRRGMKILLDMETQYVTERHTWFVDSYHDTTSPWGSMIWYNGPGNTLPESGPYGLAYLPMYRGDSLRMVSLDMHSPTLLEYSKTLYRFWVDPDGSGSGTDAIDGYRMDHVMDDLDVKGVKTGLYRKFWRPVFDAVRASRPGRFILVEQADWGYGAEVLEATGADGVFAFPLMSAIESFRRDSIRHETERTLANTPSGAFQFLILENHDTDRLCTRVNGAEWKLRIAATLQFTLPGIPCVYYGQEIGMKGKAGQWGSDGNDIPRREAFEWYREVSGPGMALWYANTGPWWDGSSLRPNDGISLEEQRADSLSLWHHYASLIQARRNSVALRRGDFTYVPGDNENILAFLRLSRDEAQTMLVAVNLSDAPQKVCLDLTSAGIGSGRVLVASGPRTGEYQAIGEASSDVYELTLGPADYLLLEVR